MVLVDVDVLVELERAPVRFECVWGRGDGVWVAPDAILVGDDYGHYESVRNAVTECALEFDKHVHVDQNHCWTYHRMESGTGRTFKPKPKATDSFASLLAGYA